MPTSLLANSRTQIHFRCIDWDGVRTDVVLAPQTIAAYQMEHHNVYNHQINLDYLKYHQSVKLPRILCYQCIAHNPQHTQQFAVIDVWFQGWCAPFLPIHLHTTITETACSLSLCLVPSCLMVAHACDMSAWVAHKGWSRGVIETCVCNALELSFAQ